MKDNRHTEHTRMQRIVAIKMLPVERMADEVAIGSFTTKSARLRG